MVERFGEHNPTGEGTSRWVALANAGNSAEADSTYDQVPLRTIHFR